MHDSARERFLAKLAQRRQAIVDTWFQAIAATGYVSLSTWEIKANLSNLVDLAGQILVAEPFDRAQARQIGTSVAAMHYLHSSVPGRTVDILGRELAACMPAGETGWSQPRLIDLLSAVVDGYFECAYALVLAEQEGVRSALVAELQTTERALRQARDELENRVQARTAELARSNENLRAEIEERKRVQRALQASERRYRAVVEDQTELISRFRPDGTVTFVNEAYSRFFEQPSEALIGQRFHRWMSELDRTRFAQLLSALTPRDPVLTVERHPTIFQPRDRWLQWTVRGLFDADGRLVEVQAVGRDVTERRLAEEALRESEARWRSLVQNAPDLVITVNREGRILYVNRAPPGSKVTVDDIIGTNVVEYALPEYWEVVRQAIYSAFDEGEQGYYEVPVGTFDDLVWNAVRIGPIYEAGQVEQAMLVVRDISERKRLEEMKDDLIRDVSHELRTPLAKVQMSLELIREQILNEGTDRARTERMAELAFRNVDRMLHMVEGILDLSRLEAEKDNLQDEILSMADLIHEAVGYMHSLALDKGLYLDAEIEEGLPPVRGDREKLFRVLVNLVENALKFTTEGGMTIVACARDGQVQVAVSDTGQGISPENLEQVFERFFQEKAHNAGVGIGLTLCRAIVEAHGGRIWASSPGSGQGSTFQFVLPAVEEVQ